MLHAIVALAVIGGALGLLLGISNVYLHVEEDERIEKVTELLPGANCGGCGYPGCNGLAEALVEGKVNKTSTCVVASAKIKEDIAQYLSETPGPDGNTLKVNV